MNNLIPLLGLGALLWFMFKPDEAEAETPGTGTGTATRTLIPFSPTARPVASKAIFVNPRGGCNGLEVDGNSGADDLVRVT